MLRQFTESLLPMGNRLLEVPDIPEILEIRKIAVLCNMCVGAPMGSKSSLFSPEINEINK